MKRSALLAVFLAGGVALVVGCSGSGKAHLKTPPLAPVAGTVLLDGKAMPEGEVVFNNASYPAQVIPIKDGKFSGQAYTGKTRADVVFNKDGPPHPMDPSIRMKVNVVSDKFSGPASPLTFDVPEGGRSDLKFEVTSATPAGK